MYDPTANPNDFSVGPPPVPAAPVATATPRAYYYDAAPATGGSFGGGSFGAAAQPALHHHAHYHYAPPGERPTSPTFGLDDSPPHYHGHGGLAPASYGRDHLQATGGVGGVVPGTGGYGDVEGRSSHSRSGSWQPPPPNMSLTPPFYGGYAGYSAPQVGPAYLSGAGAYVPAASGHDYVHNAAVGAEAPAAAAAGSDYQGADANDVDNDGGSSYNSSDLPSSISDVVWLLRYIGVNPKQPILSFSQLSSSFFVVAFRMLFRLQPDDPFNARVIHNPTTQEDRVLNAQAVLGALEQRLNQSLAHISAEGVAGHDERDIARLVRVFVDIARTREDALEENATSRRSTGAPPSGLVDWVRTLHLPHRPTLDALDAPSAGARRGSGAPVPARGAEGPLQRRTRQLSALLHAADVPRVQVMPPEPARPTAVRVAAASQRAPVMARSGALTARPDEEASLRALRAAQRDARTERLRAERFLEEAHAAVVREAVRRTSVEEAALTRSVRQRLRDQRRDFIELDKYAKEKDARMRELYRDALSSKAVAQVTQRAAFVRGVHRQAAHAVQCEMDRLQCERRQYATEVASQFDALAARRDAHLSQLCSWRIAVAR